MFKRAFRKSDFAFEDFFEMERSNWEALLYSITKSLSSKSLISFNSVRILDIKGPPFDKIILLPIGN